LSDYIDVAYAEPGYVLGLIGSSQVSRTGTLMAHRFDPERLELIGEPSPVADGIEYANGLARGAFSVSANGILVYTNIIRMPTERLTWFDRDGRPGGNVGGSVAYTEPSLSPDEKTIAAERLDPETRSEDLWLIDTVRGVPSRFTSDPTFENRPVWSPDGDRIVFSSPRGSPPAPFQKQVSGSGTEERLITATIDNSQPTDWSRDGRFLAYSSLHPTKQWDLWLFPMSDATDRKPVLYLQSKFNEHIGQFSPDGRWLAYVSDASGINEVYVGTLPQFSIARQVSASGGSQPRWRGDGGELFYVAADGMLMSVAVKAGATFEAGAPVALFKTAIRRVRVSGTYVYTQNYAVTRDGRRFLISAASGQPNTAPTNIILNWTAALRPQ
jgi:dipeptidyl aminopeptidase/acylaminoacyl peptidase